MDVEVCKIFEVPMSDRLIFFCFKTHVLFCSCVKPNQETEERHVQQNKVAHFVFALRGMEFWRALAVYDISELP